MSLTTIKAVREGLFISSDEVRGMGLPAALATLIANTWEDKVIKAEPAATGVKVGAECGAISPIERMLGGQPEMFEHEGYRIYPLGEVAYDVPRETDLWVCENADVTRMSISWCPTSDRQRIIDNAASIYSLNIAVADLDEVLALMAQDFSVLPSEYEE